MNDRWLTRFKESIVPQLIEELKAEQILLFGSRLSGLADEDSDIDVIVVSEIFIDMPFIKRMPFILKKIKFDKHIDFICYSPTEFQKMRHTSSIVIDALKYGEFLVA